MDKKNIRTEVDASYLYAVLAEKEQDEAVAQIFRQMSELERGHAIAFLGKMGLGPADLPQPSWRAKMLVRIGKVLGYEFLLGTLLETEKSISASLLQGRKKRAAPPAVSDTAHVQILQNIFQTSGSIQGSVLARFEKRHRSVGGNALRAAVLGGNDGLVSNFSLVMGMAGASGGQSEILLTGIAGLLAGALSMALGEWISVKSSQELYENQMQLEMEELEANPEDETRELALIYASRGLPAGQAEEMAKAAIADKAKAHEILVREELGIQPEDLKGSAMEAAWASFVLFAIGAVIPVLPFFFTGGLTGILWSALLSGAGLFVIGAAITLFTGKSVWFSGFRQVAFGMMAAGITFGIGRLIGVSIAG